MKTLHCILLLMSGFLLLPGCDKSGMDCFTSTGKIILQERFTEPFDSIMLADNINLFLTYDTTYTITVEAGENLMNKISTNVENRELILHNTNSCNWVRSFQNPINVYVSAPYLWKVHYASSGDIQCLNRLNYDSLKIEIWGGCGIIKLDVDLHQGFFYLHQGSADLSLSGSCGVASMVSADYGLLDARSMESGFLFISSRSSNDCYVNVKEELTATIESIGNIYFYGNPKNITTTINGQGSIIAME